MIATASPGTHELVRAPGADLVLESVGPLARREYDAHGLPFHDAAHAVGSLAEACAVIRRLWTETEPFDFHGTYVQLTGAFGNPNRSSAPTRRSSSADVHPRRWSHGRFHDHEKSGWRAVPGRRRNQPQPG